MDRQRISKRWTAGAVTLAALAAAGLAGATGAGPDGTFTACKARSNGDLRLVNSASECKSNELSVAWKQTGPQGVPGVLGPPGDVGQAIARPLKALGARIDAPLAHLVQGRQLSWYRVRSQA